MSTAPPVRNADAPPVRSPRTSGNFTPTVTPLLQQGAPPVRVRRALESGEHRVPVIVRSAGGSARRHDLNRSHDDASGPMTSGEIAGQVILPADVGALRDAARRGHKEEGAESEGPSFLGMVIGATLGSFTVVALLAGWLVK
jgi:hypothetical protein